MIWICYWYDMIWYGKSNWLAVLFCFDNILGGFCFSVSCFVLLLCTVSWSSMFKCILYVCYCMFVCFWYRLQLMLFCGLCCFLFLAYWYLLWVILFFYAWFIILSYLLLLLHSLVFVIIAHCYFVFLFCLCGLQPLSVLVVLGIFV